MPAILAIAIAAAIPATSATIVGTVTWATVIAYVAFTATLVALSYLLTKAPTSEQIQSRYNIRQSDAPRLRAYGLVKNSGVVYFYEQDGDGSFHVCVAIHSGQIDGIERIHIEGEGVAGAIGVTDVAEGVNFAIVAGRFANYMRLMVFYGHPDQPDNLGSPANLLTIEASFATLWTSAHRLRGIAHIQTRIDPGYGDDATLARKTTNGIPRQIVAIYRASRVYDMRATGQVASDDSTWAYSGNPALCILDFLRHADGGRRPLTAINVDSFEVLADKCDEVVDTWRDTGPMLAFFTNGEQGAWYDPSDLTTMFQDAAGTIPVTAAGDPVGRINDKSGNGNDATQATAANRPTLQFGGGRWYLEFDGTNDWLRATYTKTQPIVRVSAIRQITWTSARQVFGGFPALTQTGASPQLTMNSGTAAPNTVAALVGADHVVTERHSGATSRIAVDNGAYTTGNAGTSVSGTLTLGASSGATNPANFRLYGYVEVGRDLTDAEITLARDYLDGAPEEGPTELRYRLCGAYTFDEDPRDVLARMLTACDSELYLDSDGKIAIRHNEWTDPALNSLVVIDEDHIISAQWNAVETAQTAINELHYTFRDPINENFEMVEGPVVRDEALIAERGETLSEDTEYDMVPSGTQAYRLATRKLRRRNPPSTLTIVTDAIGLMAFGEQNIRVTFAPLEIDGVYKVVKHTAEHVGQHEFELSEITEEMFEDVICPANPSIEFAIPAI